MCSQYCIALSRFVGRDINQKQKEEQSLSEMNLSEKYDGLTIYGHCKIATAKLFNILFFRKNATAQRLWMAFVALNSCLFWTFTTYICFLCIIYKKSQNSCLQIRAETKEK